MKGTTCELLFDISNFRSTAEGFYVGRGSHTALSASIIRMPSSGDDVANYLFSEFCSSIRDTSDILSSPRRT
jgi:hypothetical protein